MNGIAQWYSIKYKALSMDKIEQNVYVHSLMQNSSNFNATVTVTAIQHVPPTAGKVPQHFLTTKLYLVPSGTNLLFLKIL